MPVGAKVAVDDDRRAKWRAEGWHGRDDLASAIRRGASEFGDSRMRFLNDDGSRDLVLDDFLHDGERLAAGLFDLGFRPGDALVVQMPNVPEGIVTMYAAFRLGLIYVPVVHIYGANELAFIMNDVAAKGLVMPSRWRNIDYYARIRDLERETSVQQVIIVGDEKSHDSSYLSWTNLVDEAAATPVTLEVDPDDVAVICYTSGTTSSPKGAQHSSNTVLAEIRSQAVRTPRDRSEVFMQGQPAGHMAGLIGVLKCIIHGYRLSIHLPFWDASIAAQAVSDYGVTSTSGPPMLLTTLLDSADRGELELASLADYMTGGARVPPELIHRADGAGVRAYRSYGSTEHPTATGCSAQTPLDRRMHSDGPPLPGSEVAILDDEHHPVGPGQEGEVATMGPDRFLGYTDRDANAASFTADGWFLTGDIGQLDADGYLTITDRKKDIINRGGEKLASREIEEVLLRHPAVIDVAVVAYPDPLYGEKACAVVALHPGCTLTLKEVDMHFRQANVARQKTPERLEVCEAFPRTAMGKIQKEEVRRWVVAQLE